MAQYARPVADIDMSTWSKSTGTDAFALVDEVVLDTGDYIYQGGGGAAPAGVGIIIPVDHYLVLGTVVDPRTSSGHIVTFNAKKGDGTALHFCWGLYQTTTLIATGNFDLSTSDADWTYTLSGAEADAITDYSALRFAVETTDIGATYVRLNQAFLQVPDASHRRPLMGWGK